MSIADRTGRRAAVLRRLSRSAVLASLLPWAALAGPASLPAEAIEPLRSLVQRDAGAQLQFDKLKRLADSTLTRPPQPLVSIVSAGTLESDPLKVASRQSLSDMNEVEALAWTWTITGEARYADKARDYIIAWSRINRSDGHPINETKFEPMVVAYDLLRDRFAPADRARVDEWLRAKAQKTWASARNRDENYQSHRIKMLTLIGMTLGDGQLVSKARSGFEQQIQRNLRADGSSVDFERRDALHYHLYDVRPLLTTACAFSQTGQDLFHYKAANGASLAAAVQFIVPYAEGKKSHIEFAASKARFDRLRAENGERQYKPHAWQPRRAIPVFSLAGCLQGDYAKLADRLAGIPENQFVDWRAVLNHALSARGGGK